MGNKTMKRIQGYLNTFNQVGQTYHGVSRLAFTKEEQDVHQCFKDLAEELGMTVRSDAAGNTIARRSGVNEELPAVAIGSHLDTVYDGGKYDGTVGVVAGLEVVARLNEEDVTTEHPLEVIAFAAEESSRFGLSTIGSKAMIGELDASGLSEIKDRDGVTLREAMNEIGFPIDRIIESKRAQKELKAFLEIHIEQGPELDSTKKSIGVVSGIAAPTRLKIQVHGQANHSGTTSMYRRKDALTAASELILAVEELGLEEAENGTVATIGICDVVPGAMNVIPGEVTVYVDIRSIDHESKKRIFQALKQRSSTIMRRRLVDIGIEKMADETPVPLDKKVQQCLHNACDELGLSSMQMPSGAGHDVMNMAKFWPAGLLFIPCHYGISHHPDEHADIEDIDKGIDTLALAACRLTSVSEEKTP